MGPPSSSVDRKAVLSDDDDMPTLDLQMQSPSLDDAEFEDDALPPTNRNADHHTIVDMNLRTVRFLICVVVALTVAFSYAFVTNNPSVVGHAATAAQAEKRVAFFNVLFGTTMFTANKVFEIYTDTLIFPTLHTYLHNCSLYPGDEPQRTTSKVKNNVIFWGLRTVLILLNVGTTSLFVSQRRPTVTKTVSAASLAVEHHARWLQQSPLPVLDSVDAFFSSTAFLDSWKDELFTCTAESQWTRADVDYTSVSLGFHARRPWSDAIVQGMVATTSPVVVQLADCGAGITTMCDDAFRAHGVNTSDVVQLLARGFPASSSSSGTTMQVATGSLVAFLQATVPDALVRKATLSVERVHHTASGVASLTATVHVPRHVPSDSLLCGSIHCVVQTSSSPPQEITLQQLPGNQFWTRATTRHVLSHADGSLHEMLSFSIASPQSFPSSFRFAVDDDGSHIAVHNLSSLAPRPTRLVTLNTVVLPEASGLTTWLPVPQTLPSSRACDPLVDAYVVQFQRETAALSSAHVATTMATATLLFLTQDATYHPSTQAALAVARRLATNTTTTKAPADGKTVQLTLSISIYSASATFAGCGVMIVLMLFVILRPAARVRLSPNTTPAAQYVQILTDDLYPNIVHKKRLRFANGEALPFNEYVVDSIVLHAKRDTSKKIYL